jgi:type I restriction enzyme, S subunit
MAGEWPLVTAGKLAESISKTHPLEKDRLVFLNTSDVLNGKALHHNYSLVRDWPGQAKKSIQRNDILFSEIRPANGRWAYIDFDSEDYVVSTKLMVIRSKDKSVFPRFLYHFLTSEETTHWLQHLAESRSGTFPQITFDQVAELELALPPLEEQKRIANFLDGIDNKLELNQRMNETLQAIARALFKSWFVDFDPVRAKAEGRDTGLPGEIADLFPDRFVDSELGEAPKGWKTEPLGWHFDAVKGVSYKGNGLSDAGMPLHNLNSIFEGGGYKYEGIKHYNGEFAARHIVRPGDVIVANTEQGHNRLLIGYAAIVPRIFGEDGICSHHIYRLRPKKESHLASQFICALLNSSVMHDIVSGYANGTTVNMLPIDGVQKPLILVPPAELVATFEKFARNGFERAEEMEGESRTLAELRDTLLPKLMSGEVQI